MHDRPRYNRELGPAQVPLFESLPLLNSLFTPLRSQKREVTILPLFKILGIEGNMNNVKLQVKYKQFNKHNIFEQNININKSGGNVRPCDNDRAP